MRNRTLVAKTQNKTKDAQSLKLSTYLPRLRAMAIARRLNSPLSRIVETFSAHPDIPLIICRRAKRTYLLKKIQLLF